MLLVSVCHNILFARHLKGFLSSVTLVILFSVYSYSIPGHFFSSCYFSPSFSSSGSGNHELDNGLDVLEQRLSETNFPWLISNVKDRSTNEPLAHCQRLHVLSRAGIKFGFMGLASLEWLSTLSEISIDQLDYTPFTECATALAKELREDHGCTFVVALTHMRVGDDVKLADTVPGVDIILGGHDHIVWKRFVKGRWLLKSGTDFKNYATIDLYSPSLEHAQTNDAKSVSDIFVEEPVVHGVTSDIEKDEYFETFCHDKLKLLGEGYFDHLATCSTDLDGRFVSIRTRETGLGNLICDAISSQLDTPISLVNSGSFRSDSIDPAGDITRRTIDTVLPFQDETIIIRCVGKSLLSYLENSVSQYPLLDGRFCQVSGVWFTFDPLKTPGKRVVSSSVRCLSEDGRVQPLNLLSVYRVAFKTYMFNGKDGFPEGDPNDIIRKAEVSLPTMVVNYLHSLPRKEDSPPLISPRVEGRIVCLNEDATLQGYYRDTD